VLLTRFGLPVPKHCCNVLGAAEVLGMGGNRSPEHLEVEGRNSDSLPQGLHGPILVIVPPLCFPNAGGKYQIVVFKELRLRTPVQKFLTMAFGRNTVVCSVAPSAVVLVNLRTSPL
jgi:hypothetical protein